MSQPPAGSAALAARLTWGALRSTTLDADERARIALGLGGVVLFERNVGSPHELRALTGEIRAAAPGPIRIAVDQEGGYVTRIGDPLTSFPGPMAIAATRSTRLAAAVARASARGLRAFGIDTVLAPVLDVASVLDNPSIGTRAFSDDRLLVAWLGAAMVRGFLDGGVIPVPKHFPGHGRTSLDSHVSAPVLAGTIDDLAAHDLPPFRAAVRAGAPVLMTSHVVYEALGDGMPASVSAAATDVARRGLRFDGLLLTDALVMDAITERMRLEDAGVLAIQAGADAAMAIEGQRRVLDGLDAAIREGRVARTRIREALQRADALERLASSLADGAVVGSDPLDDAVAAAVHATIAREVAERSITLVAGDPVATIGAADRILVVDVVGRPGSPIEGPTDAQPAAGAALAGALPRARTIVVDPDGSADLDAVLAGAQDGGAVVLLTRDAYASPPAATLVEAIGRGPVPSVHVALRNPLDLTLPGPTAGVAAYADTPATIGALAACLTGRAPFRGHLPVRLRGIEPASTRSVA